MMPVNSSAAESKASSTQDLLATLWQRGLPLLRERLALLDQAAGSAKLSDADRAEAAGTAHKLAGSLGMYGYAEGTKIARSLEVELEAGAASVTLKPLAVRLRKSLQL